MKTSKLPSGKVVIHVPTKKVDKFIYTHLEKVYKTPRNSHDTTKDLLEDIEHLNSKVQNLLDEMNKAWSSDNSNDNAVNYKEIVNLRWMVHNLNRLEIKVKMAAKLISTHLEKIYKPPRNSYDYRNEDSPEARFNRLYKDKLED